MFIYEFWICFPSSLEHSLTNVSGKRWQYWIMLRMAVAENFWDFFNSSSVYHLPRFSDSFDSSRSLISRHLVTNSDCRQRRLNRRYQRNRTGTGGEDRMVYLHVKPLWGVSVNIFFDNCAMQKWMLLWVIPTMFFFLRCGFCYLTW